MTIEVKPEQAEAIRKAIEAGLIETPDEVIELGLQSVREQAIEAPPKVSADEWIRKMREWSRSHSTDTPLLSDEAISRESMYEDRGL